MKHFHKWVLVVCLFFAAFQSFACECQINNEDNWVPLVERSIENTPFILIGKVLWTEKEYYSVKVIDVFKGKLEAGSIIKVDSDIYCSEIPTVGLVVFYAGRKTDNTFGIMTCSITRSIENFYSNTRPPLVLEDAIGKPVDLDELEKARQPLLTKNWMNEYALLNAYRNNHLKVEEPKTTKSDYLSYIAVALSLFAILVAFFRKQR